MVTAVKIAGLQPVSMLDWPGKLAAVVFLKGCNLRCPFCHNPELVLPQKNGRFLDLAEVKQQLRLKEHWLDGVVVTGGEPTMHADLINLLKEFKALGLQVKLDTNGTAPELIKALIQQKLLDFIAVDLKTQPAAYKKVVKKSEAGEQVTATVKLIAEHNLAHEIRTTVVPELVSEEDVLEVAKLLNFFGLKKYVLQQFNPQVVLDPSFKQIKPWPGDYLKEMALKCNAYVKTEVRGVR